MALTRITGVSLTTADPERLCAFYADAFGFEAVGVEHWTEPAFGRLSGIASTRAESVSLRLGDEKLELLTFTPSGMPYPDYVASNDPRFQHFAIVVSDMAKAYGRLASCNGWTAITSTAPQRLPDSSGGVTAFKFRDPEGHPLELLAFPADRTPPRWAKLSARRTCLGIDHSAIVVESTRRSIDFYTRLLGLSFIGRSLNEGEEQSRLDKLPAPQVEVTALGPAARPPHLELLCYGSVAPSGVEPRRSNDIIDTRLIFQTDDLAATYLRLAEATEFVSQGVVKVRSGISAALLRDPDRHAIVLMDGS
jgi:catechol 2,3-dioxygenase-like lactoylglutathione lyase family enzyme